jgi:hypothetical protein
MEHNEAVTVLQKWLGADADILTSGSGKVYVGMWMTPMEDFRCVAHGDSVSEAVEVACEAWAAYKEEVENLLPDGVEMDEGIVADQYQMDADPDEAADAIRLYGRGEPREKP